MTTSIGGTPDCGAKNKCTGRGRGRQTGWIFFLKSRRWLVANLEQQPLKRVEHPLEVEAALAPSDLGVRTSHCFRRNPDSMRRGNEASAAVAAG